MTWWELGWLMFTLAVWVLVALVAALVWLAWRERRR